MLGKAIVLVPISGDVAIPSKARWSTVKFCPLNTLPRYERRLKVGINGGVTQIGEVDKVSPPKIA